MTYPKTKCIFTCVDIFPFVSLCKYMCLQSFTQMYYHVHIYIYIYIRHVLPLLENNGFSFTICVSFTFEIIVVLCAQLILVLFVLKPFWYYALCKNS